MKVTLIRITSLLFATAILLLGHGLAGTLLTLRAAAEHYSETQIGLIMSAYFVGYIVGTLYCPALINRIGHIRAFTVAAAICATSLLLQSLYTDFWFWLVIRLLYGTGIVSFYLVVESWLNTRIENMQRGRIFAIYMLVNLSAMAAGQQLLLLGNVLTMELFVIASALLSFSLVPVALTRFPEPEKVEKPVLNIKQLFRYSSLGMAGCVASGLASGAFWTMGPLFAYQVGMGVEYTAAYMTVTIVGGALMQWPIGYYSDHHDRRKAIVLSSLGSGFFALLSIFVGEMPKLIMLIVMFLYGGLSFSLYSLSVAHANDAISEEERFKLSGGLLMAYGIGAVMGPLFSGMAMQSLGAYALPVFFAACWFILAIPVIAQLRKGEPGGEENVSFSPLIRTTAIPIDVQYTSNDNDRRST